MRFLRRLGQKGKALDKMLFDAIEQKDEAAVAAALTSGADPNARAELLNDRDVTPLMLAAWGCVPSIGLRLLQAGAQVNSRNAWGTALHRAAWRGDLRMIALLVQHGADIHMEDGSGQHPKVYALAEGHWKAQRFSVIGVFVPIVIGGYAAAAPGHFGSFLGLAELLVGLWLFFGAGSYIETIRNDYFSIGLRIHRIRSLRL